MQSLNPYGFKDFFYNTAERSSQADLHSLRDTTKDDVNSITMVFLYKGLFTCISNYSPLLSPSTITWGCLP